MQFQEQNLGRLFTSEPRGGGSNPSRRATFWLVDAKNKAIRPMFSARLRSRFHNKSAKLGVT